MWLIYTLMATSHFFILVSNPTVKLLPFLAAHCLLLFFLLIFLRIDGLIFLLRKRFLPCHLIKFSLLFFETLITGSCFVYNFVFDNYLLEMLNRKTLIRTFLSNNRLTVNTFHYILINIVNDIIYFNSLVAHSAHLAVSSSFSNLQPHLELKITPPCTTRMLAVGPGVPFSNSMDESKRIQPQKLIVSQNSGFGGQLYQLFRREAWNSGFWQASIRSGKLITTVCKGVWYSVHKSGSGPIFRLRATMNRNWNDRLRATINRKETIGCGPQLTEKKQ